MQCERCNKRKAAVFYRENISGRIRALHLCSECAEHLEEAGELEDICTAISGFLSPFSLNDDGVFTLPFQPILQSPTRSARKCPHCGATLTEIAAEGRVGCASCYDFFSDELSGTIRSTHGRSEHTGRVSAGHRARKEKAERLAGLRKQLKEAIATERFEAAVDLRDAIRALETEL